MWAAGPRLMYPPERGRKKEEGREKREKKYCKLLVWHTQAVDHQFAPFKAKHTCMIQVAGQSTAKAAIFRRSLRTDIHTSYVNKREK